MYCTVLLFITMIFVALTNRYMWKVQNSTILEGQKYLILSRKSFAKLTQKAGRVSSTFLFPSHVFSCPPYATGLRHDKHFRGPLRLTNDSFHAHIQYSITFYYYICHMNNYINVTGPNFNHFGRLGICYFEQEGFCKTHPKSQESLVHIPAPILCVLMSLICQWSEIS